MTDVKASETKLNVVADDLAKVGEVEAEIREFVRRDATQLRRPGDANIEVAGNINSLVQRVAGSSLREIDNLIRELELVRDFLQNEGERVQRELVTYAQNSQAAMNSTKVIADSVAQWKKQADTARKH